MGRPKKWPTYALESLERTVDELKELEEAAEQAQDLLLAGKTLEAIRQMGDVRVMALECVSNLVEARIGKYTQQQEKATRWQQPEAQAAKAVIQAVAARRP